MNRKVPCFELYMCIYHCYTVLNIRYTSNKNLSNRVSQIVLEKLISLQPYSVVWCFSWASATIEAGSNKMNLTAMCGIQISYAH